MKPAAFLSRLSRRIGSFAGDRRGVSAVEFAMILPLMVTLYLGVGEVSEGISISRKVTLTSHAVADLAAQATSISNTEMTNILNASAAVVAPYNSTALKVTVTQVTIDSTGKATVSWSDTLNGTARSGDVTSLIPTGLRIAGSTLIWGEVTYAYKPTIGYVVTGTVNLKEQMFTRPRLSATITRTTS